MFALTSVMGVGGGTRAHTQVAQLEQLQLGRDSEGSYEAGPKGWRPLNVGEAQVGRKYPFCEYGYGGPALLSTA